MLVSSESFDRGAPASALFDTVGVGTNNALAVDSAVGRNGTSGLRVSIQSRQNDAYAQRNVVTAATYIMGFGFNPSAIGTNLDGQIIAAYFDGATTQVDLRVNADGHLVATRNGTQLGSVSSQALIVNDYVHIQFKATIDPTAGVVHVKVNGVDWLNLTGQNTRATGSDQIGSLRLGHTGYGGGATLVPIAVFYYDDFWLVDTTGGENASFIGDCRVEAVFPNGVGNYSQFTVSPSGDNYTAVDDAAPNDDTDYVESGTVGNKDSYAFGNIAPALADVRGMVLWSYMKKTDAGERLMRTLVRSGTSEGESSDIAPGTAYAFLAGIHEVDPATSARFTVSALNAAEIGLKVQS